ncbi:MAG TPA: rhodanese-like domain-containing protein [Bacteroidales bacterium]|nr:rhodanese-like domain-containing protein [Bacteroidales bacterium]HSA42078.1 rhodanese-like domain-containing protein [Bacteroidales bacterium]
MQFYHKIPGKLVIAFAAFVLLIVAGFIMMKRPYVSFSLSPQESLAVMSGDAHLLTLADAKQIIRKEDPGYYFVDIRDPYEYVKGHLKGSLNIPLTRLLDKAHIRSFRRLMADSVKVVLTGKDESSVNAAAYLLVQTGLRNVMALEGGYGMLAGENDQDSIPREKAEKAWYDYAALMKAAPRASESVTVAGPAKVKKPVKPQPARKGRSEGC